MMKRCARTVQTNFASTVSAKISLSPPAKKPAVFLAYLPAGLVPDGA